LPFDSIKSAGLGVKLEEKVYQGEIEKKRTLASYELTKTDSAKTQTQGSGNQ